jgi:subtilase family serine protease
MRWKLPAVAVAAVVTTGLCATGGATRLPVAAGRSGTAPALTGVVVRPDAIRVGRVTAAPPTTAQCQIDYSIACYGPAQLRQAYNLPALYADGINGRGTTIVIVDSFGSPTIKGDLAAFDQAEGLPAPPSFKVIQPAGQVPAFNSSSTDMTGWAGETTLDVEYAHVIAPGASIVLVETPVSETEGTQGFPQIVTAEEYVLSHHLGGVISQSFSATEPTFPSKAALLALRGAYVDAARDHVTVLAASGDAGAADVGLDQTTYYLHAVTSWPDSDPLVTGVGGTQLHLDGSGYRTAPDSVWNDTYDAAVAEFFDGAAAPAPEASGGGKSEYFTRPSYQNGVRSVTGNARGVPDISMSAACDGAVITYSTYPGAASGWSQTCGTSEATPLFAGIVALAEQYAGHPLGLINPAIYRLAAQGAPGIVRITSGNNSVSFYQEFTEHTVHGYPADGGYSLATGVGTVNAALFVPELARAAG